MKNLSVLGSTGSIGCNVLNVVKMFPDRFNIKALAAGKNVELLCNQINSFKPQLVVVFDKEAADTLKEKLPKNTEVEIVHGVEGYNIAATLDSVDMVVSAIVGAAGLIPTLSAIDAGKTIGLANKETLVMAGDIVMNKARENNVSILPIDSEHSAIFQCLAGQRREDFSKIHLTASGGPFRTRPMDEFSEITLKDALTHPTWSMGKKISIDSATLMNKGLEVIEAKYLFDVSHEDIEVLIHPQSIVHSMVSYIDGSVIAQLGVPDMKGAIAYAMSYPERLQIKQPVPDFGTIGNLTFEDPDMIKFPCLSLAFEACNKGGTMPSVLNASNEITVQSFLDEQITFMDIPRIIEKTMEKHSIIKKPELSDILEADKWAREYTEKLIN